MEDKNKLSIVSGEEGVVISKGADDQVKTTDDELLNALVEMPDSDVFLAKLKEKKLIKEEEQRNKLTEQYKQLEPVGFEHAPDGAKKYRKKLENDKDIEQMIFLQKILVYNQDREIIKLPKINETFCSDLTGGKDMNFNDLIKLADEKGYHLLSDWNDSDSKKERKTTDWYRLINMFGKYAKEGALYYMLGFDCQIYSTTTKYNGKSDANGEETILCRLLGKYDNGSYERRWSNTRIGNRGCGFKKKD